MKAITIKQPWASLIVHGIKDIENRTWSCPKKYLGQRVLIHSSGKPLNYDNFYDSILTNEQLLALPENKSFHSLFSSYWHYRKTKSGKILVFVQAP